MKRAQPRRQPAPEAGIQRAILAGLARGARRAPLRFPRQRPDADGMNRAERAYAQHLDLLELAGEVRDWRFQPLKLRLAKGTWFTPDFQVILADGIPCLDDVKAVWRRKQADGTRVEKIHSEDDATVKIKVAAEEYPEWTFRRAALSPSRGWVWEVITP